MRARLASTQIRARCRILLKPRLKHITLAVTHTIALNGLQHNHTPTKISPEASNSKLGNLKHSTHNPQFRHTLPEQLHNKPPILQRSLRKPSSKEWRCLVPQAINKAFLHLPTIPWVRSKSLPHPVILNTRLNKGICNSLRFLRRRIIQSKAIRSMPSSKCQPICSSAMMGQTVAIH